MNLVISKWNLIAYINITSYKEHKDTYDKYLRATIVFCNNVAVSTDYRCELLMDMTCVKLSER